MRNIISITDALGRITKSTDDQLNRQTAVTKAFGTSAETTTAYKYDKAGNRLEETNGRGYTTDYQYDQLNRQSQTRDPYQIADPTNYLPTKTIYLYPYVALPAGITAFMSQVQNRTS